MIHSEKGRRVLWSPFWNTGMCLQSCRQEDVYKRQEESIVQYMKDYDASFRILEDPLMVVGIGVAFAKEDDRGICEQMSQTLEELSLIHI